MIDPATLKVGDWFWRWRADNHLRSGGMSDQANPITWHIRRLGRQTTPGSTVYLEGSDGTHLVLHWEDFYVFCKEGWR